MIPDKQEAFKSLLKDDINNVLPQNIPDSFLDDLITEAERMSEELPPDESCKPVIIPLVLYICSKTGRNVSNGHVDITVDELLSLVNMYCYRLIVEKFRRQHYFEMTLPTMETLFEKPDEFLNVAFDKDMKKIIDITDVKKVTLN